MADAKKGDSFMRHNITKKVISAMLSGVLMLSLAGCGKAAKLPETVVNTSLVVEKNGKVVSYLVNTFDKDFYSLDGLTQMVQEEAEEFNAALGDAAEPPMAVKTVQMLEEGDTVLFTDCAGAQYQYQVSQIEEVNGDDAAKMEEGDWDLTLFTCTYSGRSRVTVRCKRVQAPVSP